jgi:hypothetical protein
MRRSKRASRNNDAISESLESNRVREVGEEGYVSDLQPLDVDVVPANPDRSMKNRRRRRAKLKKFCQRKEGQEHQLNLVREFGPYGSLGILQEFRCSRCGKYSSQWKRKSEQ